MLRKLLDSQAHLFHKGGRLERFYETYEAVDTFLYTPGSVTPGSSHVRDSLDMKRLMSLVVASLVIAVSLSLGICVPPGAQNTVGKVPAMGPTIKDSVLNAEMSSWGVPRWSE